jgi:hypothetical protein
VNRVILSFPGFCFGRFDVRAASAEHFRRGMFRVIELNGVTAEATHIYDPAVSLWEAYRTMATQWRLAFEIGATQVLRGYRPTSMLELVDLVRSRSTPGARIDDSKATGVHAKIGV